MTKATRGGAFWLRCTAMYCAAAISLALAMASCGTPGVRDHMSNVTLEEAKSKLLTLQHEIVTLVPQESVVSVFESETSGLMNCQDGRKKWTGTGQVELQPGLDKGNFLDLVRDTVSGRAGWTVKDGTDKSGGRSVDILHEDGTHLLVGIWGKPESVQIDSFSACFDFPEYKYGEKY